MGWPYQQKPPMGWPLDYDHPLSDFVGAWFMQEGSGNKVFDLSGRNGNAGTFVNNPTWVAGKYGNAVNFVAGSSQYINFGDVDLLDMGANQDFTIIIDVYVTNADSVENYIRKWDGNNGYWLGRTSEGAGKWYYILEFNTAVIQGLSTNPPTAGWHQIALVVERSANATLYDNGIVVAGATQDISAQAAVDMSNADDLLIGGYASWYTDDPMNFAAIYKRILTTSEIAEQYIRPFGVFKDPAEIALLGAYQAAAVGTILPQITNAYMRI